MRVILTENIPRLGKIGDVVSVKAGYARNCLLPKSMALVADHKNVKMLAHQKRIIEQKRIRDLEDSQALADAISKLSFTIPRKVIENEKIFGSVTVNDILQSLKEEGIQLDKRNIELDEPIKELGIYTVPIHLNADVTSKLKVWVVEE